MKKIIMASLIAASFFMAAANTVKAILVTPIYITNTVTISASAIAQGDTNTSGTTTTVSTTKVSLDTKELLSLLAFDEHVTGNYTPTNFPSGAQLILIVGVNVTYGDFRVVDKSGSLLLDVSNILTATHGVQTVGSGKKNDSTGLFTSASQLRIFTIAYDDSALADNLNVVFYLSGVETKSIKNSTPKDNIYTESVSTKVSPAVGEGIFHGAPFVATGTIDLKGSAQLNLINE